MGSGEPMEPDEAAGDGMNAALMLLRDHQGQVEFV
jgi:hypothetical protein